MGTAVAMTRDAELVRGGSEDDVTRLLHCGGRLVKRGSTLHVREGGLVLQVPYALVSFAHKRVLVLLQPQGPPIPERRHVVHHLP